MKHIQLTAALLLLAASHGQLWASGTAPSQTVEIKAVRDPALQPYRVMATGFSTMDQHRALAPQAKALRFRLNARRGAPSGVMDGLTLRIEGKNTAIPVAMDAGFTFTLPRSASAHSDNAQLNLSRNQAFIRWVPEVRSEGVPAGFARLGDARMECQVLVAIAKKATGFMMSAAVSAAVGTPDWCSRKEFEVPTFSERRLAAATLIHGGERIALKIADEGEGFFAPLADLRYTNDDLIELTYAP